LRQTVSSLRHRPSTSPSPARPSFGKAEFVRIRVRRLGSEVGTDWEMDRTGLLERSTCWSRRRSGKLESVLMALSVRSRESS